MFGRRKQTTDETAPAQVTGPGKNRPTPRRRDVEAGRRQPLVPAGRASGGKAGGKAAREAARGERLHARQQMLAGDERYLAARDRGPVRRYARDVVDARWSLGELLLPVMLVVLILSFAGSSMQTKNPQIYTVIFSITYAMVLLSVIDSFMLSRRLKKRVTAKFGPDAYVRGTSMYAVMRAFQIRRTRVPKPQVRRGQTPD